MATKEKLRNSIINKIKKLPKDKLQNLDSYVNDLESQVTIEKSPLSYNGIFKDLELNELTSELHKSRKDNNE